MLFTAFCKIEQNQFANLALLQHEAYGVGSWTLPNDIAILTFATPVTIGGNTQPATLPVDDSNSYAGYTCVITGWGSTGTVRTSVKKCVRPTCSFHYY